VDTIDLDIESSEDEFLLTNNLINNCLKSPPLNISFIEMQNEMISQYKGLVLCGFLTFINLNQSHNVLLEDIIAIENFYYDDDNVNTHRSQKYTRHLELGENRELYFLQLMGINFNWYNKYTCVLDSTSLLQGIDLSFILGVIIIKYRVQRKQESFSYITI
ncbi:hypothetical protein ACJX0J_013631, partial [Zea mays]